MPVQPGATQYTGVIRLDYLAASPRPKVACFAPCGARRGQLAHPGAIRVNIPRAMSITALVEPSPPSNRSLLRRIAAAFAVFSPRHWCSLAHSPMPELREVEREWRVSAR
jgi:hypothetical protein